MERAASSCRIRSDISDIFAWSLSVSAKTNLRCTSDHVGAKRKSGKANAPRPLSCDETPIRADGRTSSSSTAEKRINELAAIKKERKRLSPRTRYRLVAFQLKSNTQTKKRVSSCTVSRRVVFKGKRIKERKERKEKDERPAEPENPKPLDRTVHDGTSK